MRNRSIDFALVTENAAAPLLWRSEFRNAAMGLIRRQAVTVDFAVSAFAAAEAMISGREHATNTHSVLSQAVTTRLTGYDLEFVVLAQALLVTLVTFDKEVLAAFPAVAVHPADFAGHDAEPPRV